jgi:hypothetical protein
MVTICIFSTFAPMAQPGSLSFCSTIAVYDTLLSFVCCISLQIDSTTRVLIAPYH